MFFDMQELACISAWPCASISSLCQQDGSHEGICPPQCATCISMCHSPPPPPDLLLHPLPCHLFLCPHPIQNSLQMTKSLPSFKRISGHTFFRKMNQELLYWPIPVLMPAVWNLFVEEIVNSSSVDTMLALLETPPAVCLLYRRHYFKYLLNSIRLNSFFPSLADTIDEEFALTSLPETFE